MSGNVCPGSFTSPRLSSPAKRPMCGTSYPGRQRYSLCRTLTAHRVWRYNNFNQWSDRFNRGLESRFSIKWYRLEDVSNCKSYVSVQQPLNSAEKYQTLLVVQAGNIYFHVDDFKPSYIEAY